MISENSENLNRTVVNSGNRAEVVSDIGFELHPPRNSRIILTVPVATGTLEILTSKNASEGIRVPKGTGLVCTATEAFYFIPPRDFEHLTINPGETQRFELRIPKDKYCEILAYFEPSTNFIGMILFEVIDSNGFMYRTSIPVYSFQNLDRDNVNFSELFPKNFRIAGAIPSKGIPGAQKMEAGSIPVEMKNPLYENGKNAFIVFNE